MAVATAAIVCVLSVFNGFREVIAERLDTLSPDILVTPREGKTLKTPDSILSVVQATPGVEKATTTLADNALVIAGQMEMPVTLKGVQPELYAKVTGISEAIPEDYGDYLTGLPTSPGMQEAIVSIGVASRLGVVPGTVMTVFAPRREGRVNMANPVASFVMDSVTATGVYRTDQSQYDESTVMVPIELARTIFDRPGGASAIEIKTLPGVDASKIARNLSKTLGDGVEVRDRMAQHSSNFRMVQIEKWISFLFLGFILVIASFNLISSLSMLVLDKETSLGTLNAMGMTRRSIGRVFAWESLYVALIGGIAGITLGVMLCLIQQSTGVVKIGSDPSAVIVSSYPVKLDWRDLLLTAVPVAFIAVFTAWITAIFARKRINLNK